MSIEDFSTAIARSLMDDLVQLKRAARDLLNVWDRGERAGGEHDLDSLSVWFERLREQIK